MGQNMKTIIFCTQIILMLLALMSGQLTADSQYFYYYDETRQINVDIYDSVSYYVLWRGLFMDDISILCYFYGVLYGFDDAFHE